MDELDSVKFQSLLQDYRMASSISEQLECLRAIKQFIRKHFTPKQITEAK